MEQEDDEMMEETDKKIKNVSFSFFSNALLPMDIQHSNIGCNKHQTIPAFQPVHPTQL